MSRARKRPEAPTPVGWRHDIDHHHGRRRRPRRGDPHLPLPGRRGARPARRHPYVRPRHLHRGHGPVGVRQVDAAAGRGRPRPAHERRGRDRRPAARQARRGRADPAAAYVDGLRLPVLQPARRADGVRQRGAARPARRPAGRPGCRTACTRRGRPGRLGAPATARALWRAAAAGRDRAGVAHPAGRALRRRADRCARPHLGAAGPGAAALTVRPPGSDRRDGHPRPARGVVRAQHALPRRRAGRRASRPGGRRPDRRRDERARTMMLSLSRQTVRHSWPPYVGAFVALGFGITLIATAVTLAGAVDLTGRQSGVTADERVALDGFASMVGIMSAIALFMAMFVVASTFGFVVAARRRELGLLRLVGATPGQVRRMVLGESAVVAVLATVAGCLLAAVTGPALGALLEARGVIGVPLEMPAPWLSWVVAAPSGAGVALLGSWRASRRASRVSPVAALREAGLERRRPSIWQLLIGTTCLAGSVAVLVVAKEISPLFALVMAVLLPEVVVIGLVCFGGLLFPWLGGLLAGPFVGRSVSARLARDHVRTAVRTPAAI